MMINKLKGKYKIKLYDPVIKYLGKNKNLTMAESKIDALKDSEVLLIMTPWKEFKNLSLNLIKKMMKGNIVIDPYGVLKGKNFFNSKLIYFTI